MLGAAQYLDDKIYAEYISFLILIGYSQLANFGIPNFLVAKLAQVPNDNLFVKGLFPIVINQVIIVFLISDTLLVSVAIIMMNISLYFKSVGRVYNEYDSQNLADICSIALLSIGIFLFRDIIAIEIAVILGASIFPILFFIRKHQIFLHSRSNFSGLGDLYLKGLHSLGAILFNLVFPLILREFVSFSYPSELKHFTVLEKAFILLNSVMFVATVKLFALKNEDTNELFDSLTLIRILSAVLIFASSASFFLSNIMGLSVSLESTMFYSTVLSLSFVTGIYHAVYFARGKKRLLALQIISATLLFALKDTVVIFPLLIVLLLLHLFYYISLEFRSSRRVNVPLILFFAAITLMTKFPMIVVLPFIILLHGWRKLYEIIVKYSRTDEVEI